MGLFPSLPDKTQLIEVIQMEAKGWEPLLDFHDWLLRGPSALSIAERETVAAYVSALNGCEFCFGGHALRMEMYGVESEVADGLHGDIALAGVDPKMLPILNYARKLTLDQGSVTQADVDAILEAGWPEEAVNKAMLVTALFNFMNRVIHGAGVDPMAEQFRMQRESVRQLPIEKRRAANEADIGKPHYTTIKKRLGLE